MKILPNGFVAQIVDGKGCVSSKTVFMSMGEKAHPTVLYVKQGWETMPMTKNMELFKQDSELGPLFSTLSAFGKLQAMRTELEEKVAKATREKNLAA
jgi:hypothetical protein